MPNSVTVQSFQLPDISFKGTAATLRRYYTENWTDQDGVLHLSGRPGSLTDSFDEVDCTLVNRTLTVPSFEAVVSLFNGANPYAREIWQLWDRSNKARNIITGDSGWFIPSSPSPTTREVLEIANQGQFLLWPPNLYLNEVGVQRLFDAQFSLQFSTSLLIPRQVGTALLVNGMVTVNSVFTTANAPIILTAQDDLTSGTLHVTNRVEGVSFDVLSDNAGDEGVVAWAIYATS